jgi:cytochrome oxidase Cu insertion factor (SCO1/SenC/PrrC family)/thiol-disulfide isomerase/thioredoxin
MRRRQARQGAGAATRRPRPALTLAVALVAAAVVVVVAIAVGPASPTPDSSPRLSALQTNPYLDPGTRLSGPAPEIRLTDQFGRAAALSSYRGHVVVLSFDDDQCTTICPLTTAAMVEAKALLGAAGNRVELLGVNANPDATGVRWVRAYSRAHGMMNEWRFLTGSVAQLRAVWHAYHIEAAVQAGQIDHTPALYIVDSRGRLARLYVTQMAYSSIDQQAQVMAREISTLLPGHPRPRSSLSYERIPAIGPARSVALARAGGGSVRVGADGRPRLYVFFASWLTETTDLAHGLESLRGYADVGGLPALTAVDEGSVEPSARTLGDFLRSLPAPLRYPVAIDRSGRVADGYLVQDQPWFVLVSGSGHIDWYWDATTQGWPTIAALERHVRAALRAPPKPVVPNSPQQSRLLASSPPPLAALHAQAGKLLGSESALQKRLAALRGYPVVVNAWASWCDNCVAEYPLFASASVRYGTRVAFVGVDTEDDSTGAALSFMATHPLSYPSYQSTYGQLDGLAGVFGLPTTIYINGAGTVVHVNPGVYASQGSLDGDIETYALGNVN